MKTNAGKGVPLTFTLLSLNSLGKMCQLEIRMATTSKKIEEDTGKKCFQTMQEVRQSRQQITALIQNFNENKEAVSSEDSYTAKRPLNNFKIDDARVKSDLGRPLIEARSGIRNKTSAIEDVLKVCLQGNLSPIKISAIIGKCERTLEKVTVRAYRELKFINELKDYRALYIGKGESVEIALFSIKSKRVYVFYMEYAKRYENGALSCTDLLQEEGQGVQNCLIILNVLKPLKKKPIKQVQLEMNCPQVVLRQLLQE